MYKQGGLFEGQHFV